MQTMDYFQDIIDPIDSDFYLEPMDFNVDVAVPQKTPISYQEVKKAYLKLDSWGFDSETCEKALEYAIQTRPNYMSILRASLKRAVQLSLRGKARNIQYQQPNDPQKYQPNLSKSPSSKGILKKTDQDILIKPEFYKNSPSRKEEPINPVARIHQKKKARMSMKKLSKTRVNFALPAVEIDASDDAEKKRVGPRIMDSVIPKEIVFHNKSIPRNDDMQVKSKRHSNDEKMPNAVENLKLTVAKSSTDTEMTFENQQGDAMESLDLKNGEMQSDENLKQEITTSGESILPIESSMDQHQENPSKDECLQETTCAEELTLQDTTENQSHAWNMDKPDCILRLYDVEDSTEEETDCSHEESPEEPEESDSNVGLIDECKRDNWNSDVDTMTVMPLTFPVLIPEPVEVTISNCFEAYLMDDGTSLTVIDFPIHENKLQDLLNLFESQNQITCVHFQNCGLEGDVFKSILKGMLEHLRLKQLSIACNSNLHSKEMKYLASSCISSLDVTGIHFSKESLGFLCLGITNSSLETLVMDHCRLDSKLMSEFGNLGFLVKLKRSKAYFVTKSRIQFLSLQFNELDREAGPFLAVILKSKKRHGLRSLNLRGNRLGLGITALAEALNNNSCLRLLNLRSNKLSHLSLPLLSDTLMGNTTLQVLDLSGNPIFCGNHSNSLRSLGKFLECHSGLVALSLANTGLLHQDLKDLISNLPRWKSLKHLDISYNALSVNSVKMMSLTVPLNHLLMNVEIAPMLESQFSVEEEKEVETYFYDLERICSEHAAVLNEIPQKMTSMTDAKDAAEPVILPVTTESVKTDGEQHLRNVLEQAKETLQVFQDMSSAHSDHPHEQLILQQLKHEIDYFHANLEGFDMSLIADAMIKKDYDLTMERYAHYFADCHSSDKEETDSMSILQELILASQ